MVTLFGFFQHGDVFIQLFLARKTYSINAGQLFVFFIAFPVSACDIGQFNGLDQPGVRQMWPSAEIGEVTLGIKGNFAILKVLKQIQLVFIAFFFKIGNCILFGHRLSDIYLIFFSQLIHELFHFFQLVF